MADEKQAPRKDDGPLGFGFVLGQLEDGAFIAECGEKLQDLNRKLRDHAKHFGAAKGEVTVKLSVNVDDGGTVQIDAALTTKEPKAKRQRSVMWLTESGNLSAANPRQTRLPLHEVPQAKDKAREAPAPVSTEARSV